MLNAPITLDYLLHCHISCDPHPYIHLQAWQDTRDYLVNKGMIKVKNKHTNFNDYVFTTTTKGKFFIDHLMSIPFPIEHTTYIIPETQVL